MQRNRYLEIDGIYCTTSTHEWFYDKVSSNHAQNEDKNGISLPNLVCFVLRNILTGEYDRILVDKQTKQIVYETKSLEDLRFYIDKQKIAKHFK
jgi:hypothetical protein